MPSYAYTVCTVVCLLCVLVLREARFKSQLTRLPVLQLCTVLKAAGRHPTFENLTFSSKKPEESPGSYSKRASCEDTKVLTYLCACMLLRTILTCICKYSMSQSLGTCLPPWLARDMAAPEDLTPLVEVGPCHRYSNHRVSPNSSSNSRILKDWIRGPWRFFNLWNRRKFFSRDTVYFKDSFHYTGLTVCCIQYF